MISAFYSVKRWNHGQDQSYSFPFNQSQTIYKEMLKFKKKWIRYIYKYLQNLVMPNDIFVVFSILYSALFKAINCTAPPPPSTWPKTISYSTK